MIQLFLHGIGDYFVQTDKWALNKKKAGWYGLWCCFIHCLTYSLPFLLIGSWQAVTVIFLTHFAIDRTNLIAYLIAIKNNTRKNIFEPYAKRVLDIDNFGMAKERPVFITIWIYIICDNLAHLICNYFALKYL